MFRKATEKLTEIQGKCRQRFQNLFACVLFFQGMKKSAVLDIVVQLVDAIVKRCWTDKHSLAIIGALQGWKQDRIALRGINPSNR